MEREAMYPEDVDPESGCRLPLPRREELDDAGQRTYDSLADLKGGTIRGLRGPGAEWVVAAAVQIVVNSGADPLLEERDSNPLSPVRGARLPTHSRGCSGTFRCRGGGPDLNR